MSDQEQKLIALIDDQFRIACSRMDLNERAVMFGHLPLVKLAAGKLYRGSQAKTVVEYIAMTQDVGNLGQSLFLDDLLAVKTKEGYMNFLRGLMQKAFNVQLSAAEENAMNAYSAVAFKTMEIINAHLSSLE